MQIHGFFVALSEWVASFMDLFHITLKKGADEQHRLGVDDCTERTFSRALGELWPGHPPAPQYFSKQGSCKITFLGPFPPRWSWPRSQHCLDRTGPAKATPLRRPPLRPNLAPRLPAHWCQPPLRPAAHQGRQTEVPAGQGCHTRKSTTEAPARSAGDACCPFPRPSGDWEPPPTRPKSRCHPQLPRSRRPIPLRGHCPPHLLISLEVTEHRHRRRSPGLQSTETPSGRNLQLTHSWSQPSLRPMRKDRPII